MLFVGLIKVGMLPLPFARTTAGFPPRGNFVFWPRLLVLRVQVELC